MKVRLVFEVDLEALKAKGDLCYWQECLEEDQGESVEHWDQVASVVAGGNFAAGNYSEFVRYLGTIVDKE